MKKALATLLVLVMLACCFGVGVTAIGSKTYNAAWGSPVIDGTVDDVWSKASASAFSVGTGSVRIMNDADYVYLLVELADATNEIPGNDIFYVLFDLDNDGEFDGEKIQLNFEKGKAIVLWGGAVGNNPDYFLADWNQSATATGYRYEIKLKNVMPESGSLLMEFFYREKGGSGAEAYWCGGHSAGWPTSDASTEKFGNVVFATESGQSGSGSSSGSGSQSGAQPVSGDYNAKWGSPVVDGTVDQIWSGATSAAFAIGNGSVRIMNDADYVYLLVELEDATNTLPGNDIFYVLFDLDNDGEFDAEKIQITLESNGKAYEYIGNALQNSTGTYLAEWNQSATSTGYRYEVKLKNAKPEEGSLLMEFFYRERGGSGSESYWRGGHSAGWPTNDASTEKFGKVAFAAAPAQSGSSDNPKPVSGNYSVKWGSPKIDGEIDSIWSNATASAFAVGNGSVRMMNDAEYIYLLVELADTTNEIPGNDIFYVLFDLDNDGEFDAEKIQLSFEKGNAYASIGNAPQNNADHFVADWKQVATSTGYRYEIKLKNAMPEGGSLLMEFFYREKGGSGAEAYWRGGHTAGWPTNDASTEKFGKVVFASSNADTSDNVWLVCAIALTSLAAAFVFTRKRSFI